MGNEDSDGISSTVANDKNEVTAENADISSNIIVDNIQIPDDSSLENLNTCTSETFNEKLDVAITLSDSHDKFKQISSENNSSKENLNDQGMKNGITEIESVTNITLSNNIIMENYNNQSNVAENTSILSINETNQTNIPFEDNASNDNIIDDKINSYNENFNGKLTEYCAQISTDILIEDDISSEELTTNNEITVKSLTNTYINDLNGNTSSPHNLPPEIHQDGNCFSNKNETDCNVQELDIQTIVSCELPCGLKVTLPSNLVPKDSIIISTISSTETTTTFSNGESSLLTNDSINYTSEENKDDNLENTSNLINNEEKLTENNDIISSLSREISKAIYSGTPSFYNQEINSSNKSLNDLAGTSLTNYSTTYSSGLDNATSLLDVSSPDLIGSQNTNIPGSLSCSYLGNQFNSLLGSLTNEFLVNQLSNLTSGQLNSLAGAFTNTFSEFSNSLGNSYSPSFLSTSISDTLLNEQESQKTNNDSSTSSINTYMSSNFIRESSLTNDLSSFHNEIVDRDEGNDSPSSSIDGPESVESKNSKKLQVHDALLYLDDVRKKFQGTDVYNHFLTVMRLFKGQIIDTPEVIKKVADLFKGYPYLVVGFNAFLPTGYMVKLIDDVLYAEEPGGKTWPVYNSEPPVGTALRTATEIVKQNALNSQVLSLLARDPSILKSINNPSLVLSNNFDSLSQLPLLNDASQISLSSDISLSQTTTESDISNEQMSKPMAKALLYISKIRAFYLDEDATYNKFLNILQTYQEIQDSGDNDSIEEIFRSIAQLFASNKDLLKEFSDFIPDTYVSQRYLYLDIAKEIIEANKECTNKFPTLVPNDDFLYNNKLRIKKKRKRSRSYTGLCADPPSPSSGDENIFLDNINDEEEYNSENETVNDEETKKEIEIGNEIIDEDESISQHVIEKEDIQEVTAENCTIYKELDPNEILSFLENNENMNKQESEECLFFGNLARQVRLPSEAVTIYNQLKLLDTVSGAITYADDVPYYRKVEHIFRNYPKFKSTWLEMRNKADPYRMVPERVRGPKKAFFQSLKNIGRSYRLLPADYPRPLCSGRTAFEQQFLNDDYVAFPLWLSDEKRGEGICHKKSPTEELYIKLEEERFEYDMAILVTQAGLDVLEAFWDKLQNISGRSRNKLIIDKRFGGTSDTLIERSMHRIYNHHTKFMIGCMIEKPHLFLRNVIERMKQFVEDLTKQKHACNILWREKSDKLFYKAQDYQGNVQRQFDSKLLKGKTLVNQVVEKNKALIKRQQHGDTTIKKSEFLQILPYSVNTFKEASQLILHYVRKHLYMPKKDKIIVVKIVCELLPELLCYDILPYDIDDYDGPLLDPADDNNENVENIEIDKKDMFIYLWDKNKKGFQSNEYIKKNELGKRKRDNTPDDNEPPSKIGKNEQTSEILEEIKEKFPLRSPKNYVPNFSSVEYKSIFCNDAWVMFIRHFAIICDRLDTLKRKQDHLIEMWNDEENERRKKFNKNSVNSKVTEHLKMFNTQYHESELHPDKGHPSTFYDKVFEKLLLFVSGNLKQEPFEDFIRGIFTTTSHVLYSLDKFVQVATKNCINAIGDIDEENIISLYYRMGKVIDTNSKFLDDIELNEQSEYQIVAEELIQRSKIFKLDFVKDTFNPGVSIYYKFIKQASLSDSDDEDDDENAMDIVWREFMDSLETEKLTKHMKLIIRERQKILPRNLKKKAARTNLTREEMNRLPFTHKEPDDKDIWYEGNVRALEKSSDKFCISFVPGTSDLMMRKGYTENARKFTCETDTNRKRKFENWLTNRKAELGMNERINDFEVFIENTNLVEIIHPKYHQIRLNRYVTELFSSVSDLPLPEFEMVDENDIEDEALDEEQESEETEEEDSEDELLEDEQCHNETGQEDDDENDNEDEEDEGDINDDSDGNNEVDPDGDYDENDLEEVEIKQEGTIYEYEGTRYILQHGTDENGDGTLYYTYESQAENDYDHNEYLDNYQYLHNEEIISNDDYQEEHGKEIYQENEIHLTIEESDDLGSVVDEEIESTEMHDEVHEEGTNNFNDMEGVDNVNILDNRNKEILSNEIAEENSDYINTIPEITQNISVTKNEKECSRNLEQHTSVSPTTQK